MRAASILVVVGMTCGMTFGISIFGIPAHAENKPRVDFHKLISTCQSQWTSYNTQLEDLKAKTKIWLSGLSRDEFYMLWDADDQLVVFASATWPEIFKEAPKGPWQQCVGLHLKLLRQGQITDRSTTLEQRQGFVKEWSDCVQASYLGQTLIRPLGQFVNCYQKQAQVLKD